MATAPDATTAENIHIDKEMLSRAKYDGSASQWANGAYHNILIYCTKRKVHAPHLAQRDSATQRRATYYVLEELCTGNGEMIASDYLTEARLHIEEDADGNVTSTTEFDVFWWQKQIHNHLTTRLNLPQRFLIILMAHLKPQQFRNERS